MAHIPDILRDVPLPLPMAPPSTACGIGPLGAVVNPAAARCRRLKEGVTGAARLLEQQAAWESRRLGRPAYSKKFITLTFADGDDWQPRCISDFLECVRKWLKRQGYEAALKYVHVAELQKRGAIHYHAMLWLPRKLRLPCPDKQGWWPWGMSQVQTARNPIGYLVKYATKTKPDGVAGFPKGARIYGRGGLSPRQSVELRETLAPWWVRKHYKQREQAHDDAMVTEWEEQSRWRARRVRVWGRVRDGTPCYRWHDPEGPTEAERAELLAAEDERRRIEEAQAVAYAREYGPKGCPRFQRVVGGFVNLWDGDFLPTPYRVDVQGGVVSIYLKSETLQ